MTYANLYAKKHTVRIKLRAEDNRGSKDSKVNRDSKDNRVLEPSCSFAVLLVLVSEVAAEAVLFGEDLDEHDGEEDEPDK